MRRAARIDASQPGMVEALEAMGFGVISTAALGGDAPDIIVGKLGLNLLVEVKTPGRENREKARIARQADFRARWPGTGRSGSPRLRSSRSCSTSPWC
jgi:Holliday junction resolvase